MSLTPTPQRNRLQGQLTTAVMPNVVLVAAMWVLEVIDTITFHSLDRLGIRPRDVDDLGSILVAPFLHYGWGHLANNSVLLLVLGVLVAWDGLRRWLAVSAVTVVVSGLFVWLFAAPYTVTLGASGLVFGWLTYLLVRAFYSRSWPEALIALGLAALYGSVLWGVLPLRDGVSWQAHLGGALGGVLAAWLVHRRRPARERAFLTH